MNGDISGEGVLRNGYVFVLDDSGNLVQRPSNNMNSAYDDMVAAMEASYSDKSPFVPKNSNNTGFVNGLTGLLSKAIDVAGDYGSAKLIQSVYPTGQTSPGVVNAQATAAAQNAAAQGKIFGLPQGVVIGGGIALAAIVLLVVIAKK